MSDGFKIESSGTLKVEDCVVIPDPKDARIKELEDALRPFAKHAAFFPSHENDEHFDCHPKDADFSYVDSELTVGDLRRAAKALSEGSKK